MVRFYWCHTANCPNWGRARKRLPTDSRCECCFQRMKCAAPGEQFNLDEKGAE